MIKEKADRGLTGLVLQGGGARGAYQVGALKAIAEISGQRKSPFKIVCGASAGAINAAPIAVMAEDFQFGGLLNAGLNKAAVFHGH